MSIYSLRSSSFKDKNGLLEPLPENNSVLIKESSSHNLLNEMYGTRQDERETVEQTCLHLTVVQQICKVAISTSKKENKARRKEGDTGLFASSYVLPQVENIFDTFMFSLMALRIEDYTASSMDIDEVVLPNGGQEEVTHKLQIQNHITNSPEVDFPSLLNYFS
ncbi:hypothetical protein G6F60_007422 [Rhizopus arrhizus]|nr:hypothetical protein G6F60_007422 [Rhizopus arrhizus]